MSTAIKTIGKAVSVGFAYQKIPLNIQTNITGKEVFGIAILLSFYQSFYFVDGNSFATISKSILGSCRLTFVNAQNEILYSRLPANYLVSELDQGAILPDNFAVPEIRGKIDFAKSYIESQDQPKITPRYLPLTVFYHV